MPRSTVTLVTVMMLPRPRRNIPGWTAFAHRNVPRRLTAMGLVPLLN